MARNRRSWGSVRKLGSGRFQARYLHPDTGLMTPAPITFASKTSADRWLAKKRTDLDAGTAVDDKLSNRPLREWWPGYWATVGARASSTRGNYERAWRLRIDPHLGGTAVRRIKPTTIDDFISDLVAEGVGAAKVIEAVGVLKRVLDRVVKDKALPQNPVAFREVTLPKLTEMERPVLSPAEIEKLAGTMRWARDQMLVRLLAYGGLRVGEALALRWVDIDLDKKMLTVRFSVDDESGHLIVGPTKTYAVRSVTLPDSLVKMFKEYKHDGMLVFPNRQGSHLRYHNWRRDQWNKAVLRCGITALPHDLRSTCASLLIDAGASVKDVQKHLGHKDEITTLRLYAKVRPGRSTDLAARLDALIAEAA